ncbi:X2-like carbohydrate binding domain-containing protein [[Clostridium] polysaccharolyticum]|uniref:cellulase n=1 Tax=[Clostridium] polysaccharolyticum TaxID=29364 RepID=A0A1I0CKK9_9FIRM|nr:X2-like carbohydrate binding domain-containing protein [[Clostridium] polysaccharolyticum]SET19968.1 mannan endo-1,4-beta-mannosidase [[Clostridium] polysaccharolyticum]
MKKRCYLAILAALFFFIIAPDVSGVKAATDKNHPGFRVEGRFLYDNQGEKVTLYGLNKMCTWTDKDGDPAFKEIAKTGANVVRITWSIDDTAEDLDTVLTNCRKEHMIPVIEVHDGTGKWDMLPKLVDYWTKEDIAAVLIRHQEYLILNIGNEVGDGTITNAQFTEDYSEAILRIRKAGIHVPLMIDGSSWGQDINILQACGPDLIQVDPDKNILLSVHMWWPAMYGHNAQEVIDELNESVEMNLPVVVGEFGNQWETNKQGQIPYKTIMEQCAKLDIGYIAWSWGPGNNPQDFLDMTADGTYETLNDYGTEICLTSEYSVKNLSVRPASMLTNLPPKMPSKGLPAGNLALGKPVTETSMESADYAGKYITDGNLTTRWASTSTSPAYVTIDLGAKKELKQVIIVWEAAYASQYKIQVSDDNKDWKDAYTTYSCKGGTDTIDIEASGRYVRINCMQRKNYEWGNSIFEVGVYGPESELSADINPTVAVFDKNPALRADLTIETAPKANTLLAIKNGKTTLIKGADYTVDGDVITISKNYLCTLMTGETANLVFDYDENVDPVLAIAIGDTSPVTAISPASATFNKYPAAQDDVSFTINAADFNITAIKAGTASLTADKDYVVNGNVVTIKKAFLANLPVGANEITVLFTDETQASFIVNAVFTAPNSLITPANAAFEKRAQADLIIDMALYGNTLEAIVNGSAALTEGTDYTVDGSAVTISKAYLATLPVGSETLTFQFNQGNDAVLKIKVTETIPNSKLKDKMVPFDATTGEDAKVSVQWNGNTIKTIQFGKIELKEGTDFEVDEDAIVFANSFLATLETSKSELTFVFSEGENQTLILKNTSAAVPDLTLTSSIGSWATGFTGSFTVTNTSDEAVEDWTVKIKKDGFKITNIWCADVEETDDYYVITPMTWNSNLSAGAFTSFGFQGEGALADDFEYVVE